MAEELARYLRGWIGYFGICETPSVLQSLEEWTSDLRNCENGEWARTLPQKRRAAPTVRGSWQTARPSHSHCPTLTLPRSGSLL
jgi:Group II intron, maturase-specific domain